MRSALVRAIRSAYSAAGRSALLAVFKATAMGPDIAVGASPASTRHPPDADLGGNLPNGRMRDLPGSSAFLCDAIIDHSRVPSQGRTACCFDAAHRLGLRNFCRLSITLETIISYALLPYRR
jgi:hypothetical protein